MTNSAPADASRLDSLKTWTHMIYALHAFSLLTGILGAATIIGAFLTGWPSIIAVILNYVKRGDTRGTWLESHFRWQIRTFWFAVPWALAGLLLWLTFLLIPLALVLWGITGLWVAYRVARGWIALAGGREMPQPRS